MSTALDSESKSIIEATLRRFVEESYDFSHRRERVAISPIDYRRFWPTLADLGVLGVPFDEKLGGLGGHALDIADTVVSLAKGLILEPFVDSAVIAGSVMAARGDAQQDVERLTAGEMVDVLIGGRLGSEDSLVATAEAGGFRLNGVLRVQLFAAEADSWLIAARSAESGSALVLRVPQDKVKAQILTYRLLDDRPAADVKFEGTVVPASCLWLEGDQAEAALNRAQELAVCSLVADAVGVMAGLVDDTGEYLRARKQFGVSLSAFQALQHRYADMHMAYRESCAILRRLALGIERESNEVIRWLTRAAALVVERAAARIGHEAIQMHGGMGVTDELPVSHYNNRLVVLTRQLQSWIDMNADVVEPEPGGYDEAATEDGFDEPAFRKEVRGFIKENLDPETRHRVHNGLYMEKADYVQWQKALRKRGWFGATWPEEFGGQGWGVRKEHVFLQECALNAAPMLIPYGVNMLGPVLHTFGNEQQQQKYLPGILDSDTWWCQGYSEPNAGSDLAALSTTAVRDGGEFVVNGTKMWTTEAHWADMMHCLVRTDRSGKKQQGITFLLIDMRTPGITVEPIVTLDGVHHTNQVFFDDVRVPVDNMVGEEGDGWKIAKFLLSRERGFIADTGGKLRMMREIRRSLEIYAPISAQRSFLLKQRHIELEASLEALLALEQDSVEAWARGQDDGIGASMLKVLGTELLQRMTEFWRDVFGSYGACYDVTLHKKGNGLASHQPWEQAASVNYAYLYSRCWSIFGGTNEVQRNIIAANLLRG